MSRAAYPKEMVNRAHELRKKGYSHSAISVRLFIEFHTSVGESTVRDWVKYFSRGAAK